MFQAYFCALLQDLRTIRIKFHKVKMAVTVNESHVQDKDINDKTAVIPLKLSVREMEYVLLAPVTNTASIDMNKIGFGIITDTA